MQMNLSITQLIFTNKEELHIWYYLYNSCSLEPD